MLDFNDFQPIEDNPSQNNNLSSPQNENGNLGMDQMNNMFQNLDNLNENKLNPLNQKFDEEEEKRLMARQKEAEERKEKINKKIEQEEKMRNDIRQKAVEYMAEFEAKRQELIAKKRKELEEKELNRNKDSNPQGNSEMWSKVSGNIDMRESDYKGSKDVQRMREAMMNRQQDPNSEPIKNFFG